MLHKLRGAIGNFFKSNTILYKRYVRLGMKMCGKVAVLLYSKVATLPHIFRHTCWASIIVALVIFISVTLTSQMGLGIGFRICMQGAWAALGLSQLFFLVSIWTHLPVDEPTAQESSPLKEKGLDPKIALDATGPWPGRMRCLKASHQPPAIPLAWHLNAYLLKESN